MRGPVLVAVAGLAALLGAVATDDATIFDAEGRQSDPAVEVRRSILAGDEPSAALRQLLAEQAAASLSRGRLDPAVETTAADASAGTIAEENTQERDAEGVLDNEDAGPTAAALDRDHTFDASPADGDGDRTPDHDIGADEGAEGAEVAGDDMAAAAPAADLHTLAVEQEGEVEQRHQGQHYEEPGLREEQELHEQQRVEELELDAAPELDKDLELVEDQELVEDDQELDGDQTLVEDQALTETQEQDDVQELDEDQALVEDQELTEVREQGDVQELDEDQELVEDDQELDGDQALAEDQELTEAREQDDVHELDEDQELVEDDQELTEVREQDDVQELDEDQELVEDDQELTEVREQDDMQKLDEEQRKEHEDGKQDPSMEHKEKDSAPPLDFRRLQSSAVAVTELSPAVVSSGELSTITLTLASPASAVAASCTDVADPVPESCTGTADLIPAECSGVSTATIVTGCAGNAVEVPASCEDGRSAPNVDEATCIEAVCVDVLPAGGQYYRFCEWYPAYTPDCDLDAATDNSADCPAGCDVTEITPACDLLPGTDDTAECPIGCQYTEESTPICEDAFIATSTCPAGCLSVQAYTPTCDLDLQTDDSASCPVGCTQVVGDRYAFATPGNCPDEPALTVNDAFEITYDGSALTGSSLVLCYRADGATDTAEQTDVSLFVGVAYDPVVVDPEPAACTVDLDCSGNAVLVTTSGITCTGTANEVPASCSDGTSTQQSDCQSADCGGAACVWSPAYVPTCDLDASTDGTADCAAGCTSSSRSCMCVCSEGYSGADCSVLDIDCAGSWPVCEADSDCSFTAGNAESCSQPLCRYTPPVGAAAAIDESCTPDADCTSNFTPGEAATCGAGCTYQAAADEVAANPATCTGTPSDPTLTCDLDPATHGTAACHAGCVYSQATPLIPAVAESCSVTADCSFALGDPGSCGTGCTYQAPVPRIRAVQESCVPNCAFTAGDPDSCGSGCSYTAAEGTQEERCVASCSREEFTVAIAAVGNGRACPSTPPPCLNGYENCPVPSAGRAAAKQTEIQTRLDDRRMDHRSNRALKREMVDAKRASALGRIAAARASSESKFNEIELTRSFMLTSFDASKRHTAASIAASVAEVEAEWLLSEQIHSDHMDVIEEEFQNSLSVACNSTEGLCDYDDTRAPHYPVRSPHTSYGADDSDFTGAPPPLLNDCVDLYQLAGQLSGTAPPTCTGIADAPDLHPSCGASFAAASCSGTANTIQESCTGVATTTCTGTANEVPASCSDGTSTQQSDCQSADCGGAACVWSPAYVPTCDLDAGTDGTADCAAGCNEATPICDLESNTDSTAECPAGCTYTPTSTPVCDRDGATDGTAECPAGCTEDLGDSSCPAGCAFLGSADYTVNFDADPWSLAQGPVSLGTLSSVNYQWTTGYFNGGSTTACPLQSCTGGTGTNGDTCDLDAATDDTADCPSGCTQTHVARSATVAFRPADTASVSAAETSPCTFAITFATPLCRHPIDATCTGTAADRTLYPSCAQAFATNSCSGVANEVPASCSDGTSTQQSDCQSADCGGTACVWSPAYVPTCDLDASTDGTADCPAGCTADTSASSCPPGCDFSEAQTGR